MPERKEMIAMTNLLLYFLITIFSAMLITTIYLSFSEEYQPRAFKGQENNPFIAIYVLVIMLVVTALVLLISKYGKVSLLKIIFYVAVALTSLYFFFPLLALLIPYYPDLLSLTLGIILAIALYKKPEWYIMNIAGIIVSASAATVLGMSLSVLPIGIFLVIAAIYDFMAVHKTKHMLSLADVAVKEKLPVLFVSPKEEEYSYVKEEGLKKKKEERESFMMGFGDAVFPASFIISSLVYLGIYECIGSIIGTIAGFAVLMYFLTKGNAQPGLPFLNTGAIVGMLIAHFLAII